MHAGVSIHYAAAPPMFCCFYFFLNIFFTASTSTAFGSKKCRQNPYVPLTTISSSTLSCRRASSAFAVV